MTEFVAVVWNGLDTAIYRKPNFLFRSIDASDEFGMCGELYVNGTNITYIILMNVVYGYGTGKEMTSYLNHDLKSRQKYLTKLG